MIRRMGYTARENPGRAACLLHSITDRQGAGGALELADLGAVRSVQAELRALWTQIGTPQEEIAAFLESLELATPHSEAVLRVYEQASARLEREQGGKA